MDGNGRWAKARGLARTQGHLEGVKRVDEIVEAANDLGVGALTLFTFSTENWGRPEQEVSMLMQTLITALGQKLQKMCANKVRFRISGRREGAPASVLEAFDRCVAATKDNQGMVLNIAFNYGGRQEIARAARRIAEDVAQGRLKPADVTMDTVSAFLDAPDIPDPDLVIRTSGEQRLSNFLLWEAAYAELIFQDVLWPDYGAEHLKAALVEFATRDRRYGAIVPDDVLAAG